MRRPVAWVTSAAFFVPAVVLVAAAVNRPYADNQRNWLIMGAAVATLCAVLAAGLVLTCLGRDRRNTPDYDIADTVDVRTVDQLHALADPVRHLLLDLVLERAATVRELAAAVGHPKARIARDVDLLVDAGLLRVVRARPGWGVDQQFYGRTGRTIQVEVRYPRGDSEVAACIGELMHDDSKARD